MAIQQSSIAAFSNVTTVRKSINEAKLEKKPTAFLSHSHIDAHLAKGMQGFLQSKGWEVYIDWQDSAMPEHPNRETAEKIQAKIRDLDMFLYLATANSSASRWCPWEIGYADGKKDNSRIIIVQTSDSSGSTYGNEYLQLYRHLDIADTGDLASFGSNNRGYILKGAMTS